MVSNWLALITMFGFLRDSPSSWGGMDSSVRVASGWMGAPWYWSWGVQSHRLFPSSPFVFMMFVLVDSHRQAWAGSDTVIVMTVVASASLSSSSSMPRLLACCVLELYFNI